jgi:glycosyltransferase involved in cell wall biosynthesis
MVRRGVDGDKITVVPNAVDVERFGRSEPDRALQAQLGLEGSVVVGFVGSMTFYEGLDDLLVACAEIARRSSTKFAVLFVGDGPVRADLERQAEELGIAQHCRFVGRVPHEDVERYLSIIDVTPFPRKPLPVCEMVSPLKPLESMACGIAVLASDVSALSEMVGHGDHGLLFAKGDVDDLASQLERLITDAELRHDLSEKAEHWVREERTWPIMAQRVGQIYEELVS